MVIKIWSRVKRKKKKKPGLGVSHLEFIRMRAP